MAFTGIHELTLDSKNRLTVPSKQRGGLSGGVMVAKSGHDCLQVWPAEAFERSAEDLLGRVNDLTAASGEVRRQLYGLSHATELDSAGRIMLPPRLLRRARLEKDVVLVGAGKYFEVWDRSLWDAHEAELTATAADHIERLGNPA